MALERRPAGARSLSRRPVAGIAPRPRPGVRHRIVPARGGVAVGAHPRAVGGSKCASPRAHALPDHRRGVGTAALDRAARAISRHVRPRLRAPRNDSASDPHAPRAAGHPLPRGRASADPHPFGVRHCQPSDLHADRALLPRRPCSPSPAGRRFDTLLPAGFDRRTHRRATGRARGAAGVRRRLRVPHRACPRRRSPALVALRPAPRPFSRRGRRFCLCHRRTYGRAYRLRRAYRFRQFR